MNKITKILLVLLLGFVWIPVVHAENMPKTGVTYFLQYPDGSEEVVETYQESQEKNEKLIYSGYTDEDGNIPMCNLNNEGILRVVQHVPEGYTTNQSEVRINLSQDMVASFINYKGGNPNTGRSLAVLMIILAVVVGTIVISRKNKKALLVLPLVLAITASYYVQAYETQDDCFGIQVKDGKGQALEHVLVDVYAEPATIDPAPAVKFVANGGTFFDGTTTMYFRLPYTESTVDEFLDSLSDYENSFLLNNSEMAYREGYYPEGFSYPDQLVNGTEVPLTWVDDEEATLVKLVGNGGSLRFFDKSLTTVYTYEDGPWMYMLNAFEADNLYYNGYDTNSSCGNPMNMDSMITDRQENVVATYFACWTDTVDGILVNDEVMFRGSPDDCFRYSDPFVYDDGMTLYNLSGYMLGFQNINNSYVFYPLGERAYKRVEGVVSDVPKDGVGSTELFPIQSITVIYNKNQYLTLNSNDFEVVSCNQTISADVDNATGNGLDSEKASEGSPSTCYRVKNNNANQALREYFEQYETMCMNSNTVNPF